MKHMIRKYLARSVGAVLLGTLAITTAQADPIASAESIVRFENFTINWSDSTGTIIRQADYGGANGVADFTTLSVTSQQKADANVGATSVSDPSFSLDGSSIFATATVGTLDGAVSPNFPATTTTDFTVSSLPYTGDFAAAGSNEVGSPIIDFGAATQDYANLHNGAYASLDSLTTSAGAETNSTLVSDAEFVSAVGGDYLTFSFDFGAYIAAYLTSGAAQSALGDWTISFLLTDTDTGAEILNRTLTNQISDNAPGDGITRFGAQNATLTGGIPNLTSVAFTTTAAIVAGDAYNLNATIKNTARVIRVGAAPEPASLALMGIGLMGLGGMSLKSKKTARKISA